MTTKNVTVTVTGVVNNIVQCVYNPEGPYQISAGNHDVCFTLDSNSISSGWQYTGAISSTGNGQLSTSGSGNSVTVSDTDTFAGTYSYNLGMSLNGGSPLWSDPQNENKGNN